MLRCNAAIDGRCKNTSCAHFNLHRRASFCGDLWCCYYKGPQTIIKDVITTNGCVEYETLK